MASRPVDGAPHAGPLGWFARLIAELFAPAVLVTVITFVVGTASAPGLRDGVLWSAVGAAFCGVGPRWFMARGAARGRWDTHHVRDREDRLVPLLVSLGSVLAGLVVLSLGGAPRELIALVLAMLCCLTLATAVTSVWKISLHAAIAAGTVAILVITHGPWCWLGLGAVALVSWSRCATHDHTFAQVVAGSALGLAVGGALYAALLALCTAS